MADGRNFENVIKFLDFNNAKWRMDAFFKIKNTQYLKNCLTKSNLMDYGE